MILRTWRVMRIDHEGRRHTEGATMFDAAEIVFTIVITCCGLAVVGGLSRIVVVLRGQ
jgi:hypothetical protein